MGRAAAAANQEADRICLEGQSDPSKRLITGRSRCRRLRASSSASMPIGCQSVCKRSWCPAMPPLLRRFRKIAPGSGPNCRISPIRRLSSRASIWSSLSTPVSRISRARWGSRFGYCCRSMPTGVGWQIATMQPVVPERKAYIPAGRHRPGWDGVIARVQAALQDCRSLLGIMLRSD